MFTRLLLCAGVLVALTGSAAASASAASVVTSRACYLNDGSSTTAAVAGSGFTPGAPVSVRVDSLAAVTSQADASGAVGPGTVKVPALSNSVGEASHTVTINDGTNSASASFSTTRVRGDFSPSSGDPRTLKVSFSAFGFNLIAPSTVYVHYITPKGKLKQTISLGKAKGACGHITSTKMRKLFSFTAERGKWILQYDTSRKYRKGNSKTAYPWATVSVKVRRIFLR